MEPSDLRRRLAMSPRVLAVATTAVQRLASDILGTKLSRNAAESLALSGDFEVALRNLEQRRNVRRPGLSNEEEIELAAQEVGLRQTGADEEEIRALIEKSIERNRSKREVQRETDAAVNRMEALLENYEEKSPQLRYFLRRAARLWRSRTAKLRAIVSNDATLQEALDEMEEVFSNHFDEAVNIVRLKGRGE